MNRYPSIDPLLVDDIDEMVDEYGALNVMNAFAEMYPTTWALRSDVCLDQETNP